MDSHSRYFLVNDDCECCQYITNAFTLLRLPLAKISFSQLQVNPNIINHSLAVFVCTKTENQFAKKLREIIASQDSHLFSFNEKINEDENCFYLKMPFSKFELNYALSQCALSKKEDIDIIHPAFDRLIGSSATITKIKMMIKQVASSDSTVLILGQSGTGKNVIASCIHKLSERQSNPLVPINCGAIPSELMESELFGHEKGAFTGALTRRPGRFEIANTGTIFLDEIGDMPLPMQVKLLRVLQERTIERVGGNVSIKIDVRVIAATNQKLEELIQHHQFREDLFYRLNVFPIYVPSLKERSEDIPIIISFFLDKIFDRIHHRVGFTENALEILSNYSWPGNIRELENFLERMVILHRDCIIDENTIDEIYKRKNNSSVISALSESIDINEYIANMEIELIKNALDKCNGMISSAAKYLNLKKAALVEKIKKYHLEIESAT